VRHTRLLQYVDRLCDGSCHNIENRVRWQFQARIQRDPLLREKSSYCITRCAFKMCELTCLVRPDNTRNTLSAPVSKLKKQFVSSLKKISTALLRSMYLRLQNILLPLVYNEKMSDVLLLLEYHTQLRCCPFVDSRLWVENRKRSALHSRAQRVMRIAWMIKLDKFDDFIWWSYYLSAAIDLSKEKYICSEVISIWPGVERNGVIISHSILTKFFSPTVAVVVFSIDCTCSVCCSSSVKKELVIRM